MTNYVFRIILTYKKARFNHFCSPCLSSWCSWLEVGCSRRRRAPMLRRL